MRRLTLTAVLTLPLLAGCCGDGNRPRLIDRLFHHDEDCPSSRAASRPAAGRCEAQTVPMAAPVSHDPPIVVMPTTTLPPSDGGIEYAPPTAARPNELPPGRRIPGQPGL